MFLDYAKNNADNFILWSGDSDFADPIKQLLKDGKKTVLFATARRVSTELNDWSREIEGIKSKRDPINGPLSI